MILNSQLSCI